ncbi:hypothetical protein BO443_80310 [Burkholderia orbicola]
MPPPPRSETRLQAACRQRSRPNARRVYRFLLACADMCDTDDLNRHPASARRPPPGKADSAMQPRLPSSAPPSLI